jgi:hypothetical protein
MNLIKKEKKWGFCKEEIMPKSKAFNELFKSVKEQYLGKPVKKQYQKDYGKVYDKKEIKSVVYRIAKSRGMKID